MNIFFAFRLVIYLYLFLDLSLILSDIHHLYSAAFLDTGDQSLGIDINEVKCGACKLGVVLLQTLGKQNFSQEEIVSKLTSFCTTFHIENRRVCHGVVSSFQVNAVVWFYLYCMC